MQLKQGKPDEALQSFLKAGVLEPRYARASLYTGVAYYQLGNTYRAEEMMRRAMEQDPTDPLPHMMVSLIEADRLNYGAATASARKAADLMPYLKSLNQLLNNQKGNANVGSALAGFGLEEWAEAIAHEVYTPYWAGSALFLADRYSGDFNKNSELFKGFLSDPTVFGASNRFNSLVAAPGHHQTFGVRAISQEEHETEASAVFNGYSVSARPFAYYLGLDYSRLTPGSLDLSAHSRTATLGLGFKPTFETSLFGFGNSTRIDSTLTDKSIGFIGDTASIDDKRADLGGSYRFSPSSQLWLKAGHGSEDIAINGVFYSPSIASTFNDQFFADVNPTGSIDRYQSHVTQNDVQLKYVGDIGANRLSIGFEHGEEKKQLDSAVTFAPIKSTLSQTTKYDTDVGYLSDQWRGSNVMAEGTLAYTRFEQRFATASGLQFGKFNPLPPVTKRQDLDANKADPRLGLAWQPAEGSTVRLAYQQWRRPASVATLDQVDTAGIPVDDRLTALGGRLKRTRLQFEQEAGKQTFFMLYADHRQIDNPSNPSAGSVADINLQDLERLRNRNRLSLEAVDLLEETPEFSAGRVNAVGFAVNQIVSSQLALAARYQHMQTRNTSIAFNGKLIPWLPKNLMMLEANWLPMPRWQLGAQMTYRSSRYTDEANTSLLSSGWGAGLRGYWESEDKRLSVEGIAENLYSDKDAAAVRKARVGLQVIYRF
jgi:hypothetical protein